MTNNDDRSILITGEDNIRMAAIYLPLRIALKLEIGTGMRHSSGGSTIQAANRITGKNSKTKRQAYDDMNEYIVNLGGQNKPRSEWDK